MLLAFAQDALLELHKSSLAAAMHYAQPAAQQEPAPAAAPAPAQQAGGKKKKKKNKFERMRLGDLYEHPALQASSSAATRRTNPNNSWSIDSGRNLF